MRVFGTFNMNNSYFETIPTLNPLFENADYIDIKSIDSSNNLRHFIVGFIYYCPSWIQFLYKVRAVFVRLLGMRQESVDLTPSAPEDISFIPGDLCLAFTVTHGKDNQFIAMQHEDKHLSARLLVAIEPLESGINRFHVGTIVHHKHWTGPVYFTVIKPFHHLVVRQMMKAGITK